MARVALASCSAFPAGDEDAGHLLEAFRAAGHDASWELWDDPAVDWEAFDVTVVRATWDYTPRREEFLAWAGGLPLVLNPFPVLSWSSDKVYLRDLAAADVPTVPTTFVPPGEPLPEGLVGEYVVKPSVGAGSRGAGRFALPSGLDEAREHLGALHAAGRTALVQPYVADVDTTGETAVVCLGGVVSHAARKAALLPSGTVRDLVAPAQSDDHGLFLVESMSAVTPTEAEQAVARQVLDYVTARFGVTPVYARVDLLPAVDGPVVVEAELVEPSLFLGYAPDPAAAAGRLVAAVAALL
ncbi:ATP-grasp domain-containing protein [Jatrophihabitans sp. YIM 134969]